MSNDKPAGVRLQRANFVVSDLDRALVMYRDVLGLEVTFIKDSEPDSYSYPVFRIDSRARLRFAVLSAPDQPPNVQPGSAWAVNVAISLKT